MTERNKSTISSVYINNLDLNGINTRSVVYISWKSNGFKIETWGMSDETMRGREKEGKGYRELANKPREYSLNKSDSWSTIERSREIKSY